VIVRLTPTKNKHSARRGRPRGCQTTVKTQNQNWWRNRHPTRETNPSSSRASEVIETNHQTRFRNGFLGEPRVFDFPKKSPGELRRKKIPSLRCHFSERKLWTVQPGGGRRKLLRPDDGGSV